MEVGYFLQEPGLFVVVGVPLGLGVEAVGQLVVLVLMVLEYKTKHSVMIDDDYDDSDGDGTDTLTHIL